MSEIEPNNEIEIIWPTIEKIIKKVKDDIPAIDFEPMAEACMHDTGIFLGAIYSYMREFKNMTDIEAQNYLIERGLM